MTIGKWTHENFVRFDNANPEVYAMFCHFALHARTKKEKFSAKCVFHRMRWEADIETTESEYKIDDGWISHYARKFMDDYPEHEGFFELRQRLNSYHNRRFIPPPMPTEQSNLI